MKIVFIVDDCVTNLVTAEQVLLGHYEVYTFASAQSMFDLIRKITPDLIVLDLLMPEVNGFVAFRQLMNDKRYMHIPVIICTSKTDIVTEKISYEIGAADFIRKPYTEDTLLNSVRKHIDCTRAGHNR